MRGRAPTLEVGEEGTDTGGRGTDTGGRRGRAPTLSEKSAKVDLKQRHNRDQQYHREWHNREQLHVSGALFRSGRNKDASFEVAPNYPMQF